jgi:hypothetical protein
MPSTTSGCPNAMDRSAEPPIPTIRSAPAYAGRGSSIEPAMTTTGRPAAALTRPASAATSGYEGPSPTTTKRSRGSFNNPTARTARRMPSAFMSGSSRDTAVSRISSVPMPCWARKACPSTVAGSSESVFTGGSMSVGRARKAAASSTSWAVPTMSSP